MTFKEKIVKLRKLKGLTQDEFASAVGVSRQAVYKWECGQSYPEVSKLLEIKFLFGISIDDLLDESYEVIVPEKKKRRRKPKTEDGAAVAAEVKAAPAPKAEPAPAPKAEEPKAEEDYLKPMDDEEIRRELLGLAAKVEEPKAEEPAPAVAVPAPKAEPAPAPKAEEPKAEEPAPAPKAEEPKAEEPAPAPKAEELFNPDKKEDRKSLFSRLFGRK